MAGHPQARKAALEREVNGWTLWRVRKDGEPVKLSELRQQEANELRLWPSVPALSEQPRFVSFFHRCIHGFGGPGTCSYRGRTCDPGSPSL